MIQESSQRVRDEILVCLPLAFSRKLEAHIGEKVYRVVHGTCVRAAESARMLDGVVEVFSDRGDHVCCFFHRNTKTERKQTDEVSEQRHHVIIRFLVHPCLKHG